MRSADRRTNVQIEEKPEGNTQCQSPDKSVDTAVGSFADQNAIAFYPSSDATRQSEDPGKEQTSEKCPLKDRTALFDPQVVPFDPTGGVFVPTAAHAFLLPNRWSTMTTSTANESGQVSAALATNIGCAYLFRS
jgi:hypothetical protein